MLPGRRKKEEEGRASPKAIPVIEHIKLSLDDDESAYSAPTPDTSEDDEDLDDDRDYTRGRARSNSILSREDDGGSGIVLIDPSSIPSHTTGENNEPKINDKREKSGPLQYREVEALKKGIEEAVYVRAPEAVREELEERMALEEAQRSKAGTQGRSGFTDAPSGDARRLKILMLGDSGVGKSSLIIRYTQDTFSTDLVGTVGVNFKTKKLTVDNEALLLQVWDTAGQEQFHKITTSYYKGANGIMLVYDVSDKKSCENVEYWVKNITSHASDTVAVALIGNKIDLRADPNSHCLDSSHGHNFAKRFSVPYFETSAKDATNVSIAFETLARNILASLHHGDRDKSDRLTPGGAGGGAHHHSPYGRRESVGSSASATESALKSASHAGEEKKKDPKCLIS